MKVIFGITLFIVGLAASSRAADRPNVIVILADDLGRGDYSAYGTKDIRTPNIDRLFHEGMACDNFLANSCVCSPTRAALLSGCYPDRVGVPGVIRDVPEDSWGYLVKEANLLPKFLAAHQLSTDMVGRRSLRDLVPRYIGLRLLFVRACSTTGDR